MVHVHGRGWEPWEQIGWHCGNTGRTAVPGARVVVREWREVVGPGSTTKVEPKTGCAEGLEKEESGTMLGVLAEQLEE